MDPWGELRGIFSGFLIREKPDNEFLAFRNEDLYNQGVPTYAASSLSEIEGRITKAQDHGEFTMEDWEALKPEGTKTVTPKYPDYIMQKVRQRLGLEEYDTSKDDEINSMSHNAVFSHCLAWEGIIGYDYMITIMVRDIYGVILE